MTTLRTTSLVGVALGICISSGCLYWVMLDKEKKNRKRNKDTDGPWIDIHDTHVRQQVLHGALRRAQAFANDDATAATTRMKKLSTQVGGISDTKPRLLRLGPDLVLKPLQCKEFRGIREVFFYEAIQAATTTEDSGKNNNSNTVAAEVVASTTTCQEYSLHAFDARELWLLKRLSKFTVPYLGVLLSVDSSQVQYYIILHDETAMTTATTTSLGSGKQHHQRQQYLRVMDLKMGTQTFEPDASEAKKIREIKKYEAQKEFGFRLVGMMMMTSKDDDADVTPPFVRDKYYGRTLSTRQAVINMLATFFPIERHNSMNKTIADVKEQLKEQLRWFQENDRFSFHSSSILIVYDGSAPPRVRMIDFGHVRFARGGDSGYRHGLTTLISMLDELQYQREKNVYAFK